MLSFSLLHSSRNLSRSLALWSFYCTLFGPSFCLFISLLVPSSLFPNHPLSASHSFLTARLPSSSSTSHPAFTNPDPSPSIEIIFSSLTSPSSYPTALHTLCSISLHSISHCPANNCIFISLLCFSFTVVYPHSSSFSSYRSTLLRHPDFLLLHFSQFSSCYWCYWFM